MCTYKKSRVDVDLHNHRNWILHQFKDNKKPYNLYSKKYFGMQRMVIYIPSITLIKVSSSQNPNRYDLKKKCWNNCQKYYLRFDHICFLFVYCNVCDWCICDIYIYLFRSRHFWHQLFCECLSCSSYSLWM